MSRIRTNLITNRMANGAPTVSHGLVVAGVTTITGSINNLNLTGITTISTLDLNGDLDVDGHLNADNVSIAGVVTATTFSGSGASLTNLNGSNIASGTVPVARIGTGTKNTSTFYRGDGTFATVTSTTINSNADNRIITGSGTANTLNGESTLTYSGDTLLSTNSNFVIKSIDTNASNAENYIQFNAGYITYDSDATNSTGYSGHYFQADGAEKLRINGSGQLIFDDDTNTYINRPAADTISVTTGGTEAFRINSSGHLDLGRDYFSNPQNGLVGIVTVRGHRVNEAGDYAHLSFRMSSVGGTSSASIRAFRDGSNYSNGLKFYTYSSNSSPGDGVERFKIDKDGKFYKGGNQFYPLVNYVEVTSFGGVNVSSTSYTDLRTVYSNYSPKRAGNRIVIHHQSQMWNGTHATGNGDVFWRIMRDEGSGYSAFVTNERILGNHDGSSYTGGSGLARHHRTVHLMGSFICNGNNFNLKTQGRSNGSVGWDWYHDANNMLQIWEYELN